MTKKVKNSSTASLSDREKLTEEEKVFEQNLRPSNLNEYVGQEQIKENLRIFLSAAQQRNESLEHILLHHSHSAEPYCHHR